MHSLGKLALNVYKPAEYCAYMEGAGNSMADTPESSLSSTFSASSLLNTSLPASHLLSPHTLHQTLSMSTSQSLWFLTHQQFHLQPLPHPPLPPLSTVLESTLPSRLPHQAFVPTFKEERSRTFSLPTDRDYTRVQNRLNKLATGVGLTLRPLTLPEGKPLEVRLEEDEWQYLKIRLYGKSTPLQVGMRKTKGKAVIYVSKTLTEPSESLHDEVWRKETAVLTEPGLRFKSEWLFLGIKCFVDVQITLSTHFGSVNESAKRKANPGLALVDLDLFRYDESKRLNLGQTVELILKRQKLGLQVSQSSRNFVEENQKAASFRGNSTSALRGMEEQHRLKVMEKSIVLAEERRNRAEAALKKQETRKEEQAKEAELQRVKAIESSRHQLWLSLLFLSLSSDSLLARFKVRQSSLKKAQAETRAAMVIQRIYRKCIKHLNPKRLALQRATGCIRLCKGLLGPLMMPRVVGTLMGLFRDSFRSYKVREKVKKCWGEVVKIQEAWRKFGGRRKAWWEEAEQKWILALHSKAASPTLKKGKKGGKGRHNSTLRNALTDSSLRRSVLLTLWLEKCRLYRDGWRTFLGRAREGEAAEVVEGSGPPEFPWETSDEDVDKLSERAIAQS